MSEQSYPTYRILYYSTEQSVPKTIKTVQLMCDIDANNYVSELNKNCTDKEFYKWQRVTFFEKLGGRTTAY